MCIDCNELNSLISDQKVLIELQKATIKNLRKHINMQSEIIRMQEIGEKLPTPYRLILVNTEINC